MNRFRSSQIVAGVPRTLSTWLVTTDNAALANRISVRLGGAPTAWNDEAEDHIGVLTDIDHVDVVVVNSTAAIVNYLGGTQTLIPKRRAAAPSGDDATRGWEPSINLTFRLDDFDELFVFKSSSWLTAKTYPRELAAGARVTLGLRAEEYVLRFGVRAGRRVSFTSPCVEFGTERSVSNDKG